MSIILKTPDEVMIDIAKRAKAKRLALNLTQEGLANRSGVSLPSLKRFEKSGLISLSSLLDIAVVLGSLEEFEELFKPRNARPSLFSLESKPSKRKRGAIK